MTKSKTPSYVLTLGLDVKENEKLIINKRLEISRNIYNSILGSALNRYSLMKESKKYIKTKRKLKQINNLYHNTNSKIDKKELDKQRKELYKILENLKKEFKLTNYSLYEDVKPMYKHFKDNIDSLMAQAIADRVWKSLDKFLNGQGKKCYFKRYGEYNTLENKWTKSGMIYKDGNIKWKGLNIPVIIKKNDTYAQKAIQDRVKYCRVVRKEIKGKFRYYVQLVMEGIPPMKVKSTGEINSVGVGNVGIDIGTRTIAVASKYDVKLMELAPNVDKIDKRLKLIERKMDRSKRATNLNKFNDDGTINRGNKDKWNFSNRYLKLKAIRKEIFRKQAIYRKQDHESMANYIIRLGDNINVETMNFKGLQAKAKITTFNEKTGKFNKKKRFGRSLANKAPAMLIEIINRKLKYENLGINKVNTYKVKASQYNHFTDEYNKKELKDRWNKDIEIQRDLYSAFLLMNVNEDLESINRELCIETYDNFKILHDKEIKRLRELKLNGKILISSMGI